MLGLANLPGAIKEVNVAGSNKELIEALYRLTEEYFKTFGILAYSRYRNHVEKGRLEYNPDIANLIRDYMEEPSFETWIRLSGLTTTELYRISDVFAINYIRIANAELEGDMKSKVSKVFVEIHKLRMNLDFKLPKNIRTIEAIQILKQLRNFRSHNWDSNVTLQPLIDAGLKDLVITVIESLLANTTIEMLKPFSIKKSGIEAYHRRERDLKTVRCDISADSYPLLEKTYLSYGGQEAPFDVQTNLILLDEKENLVYTYSGMKNETKAYYSCIPEVGQPKKIIVEVNGLTDVFGKECGASNLPVECETLVQKYGTIQEVNGTIHNLPELTRDYIERPNIERVLIEKLSHRRLYITTLDGGGGFGKTELAKKVLYDVINNPDAGDSTRNIRFNKIIWISGKITYFKNGVIEEKENSFNTLDDLLNCICYVTNNQVITREEIEKKKNKVIEILNQEKSVLIVLDNLETTSGKDEVWQFLIKIGDKVESNIRILVTSRTLGFQGDQRLNVRQMEEEEAKQLIANEIEKYDLNHSYLNNDNLNKIIELSGKIPLLIKYFINLLSRGYNLKDLIDGAPKESDKALNFICSFQWNELCGNAKRLLMGIAKGSGKINFALAKVLCGLSDEQFNSAKEELQNRSFLVDSELINSNLLILPPICKFASSKLLENPEIEEEFDETIKMTNSNLPIKCDSGIANIVFSDEIALNHIFQRADLLIRRGDIEGAYGWLKQATSRFPESNVAWRTIGEFEFKNLDDYEKAKQSMEKAISLNPNDIVTYRQYAYLEHDRGSRQNIRHNIKRSIELNEKALKLNPDEIERRIIVHYIASSYMKLGNMYRDEAKKSSLRKDEYYGQSKTNFLQAIDILKSNIVSPATSSRDKDHNANVYSMLAGAYLTMPERNRSLRKKLDLEGLKYLIDGLKINQVHERLIYTIGHPGTKHLLESYGVVYESVNKSVVQQIMLLEPILNGQTDG